MKVINVNYCSKLDFVLLNNKELLDIGIVNLVHGRKLVNSLNIDIHATVPLMIMIIKMIYNTNK